MGRLCGNGGKDGSQRRGRGCSTSPAPSPFSQSPEPVLVEVSTEDGADISSKPERGKKKIEMKPPDTVSFKSDEKIERTSLNAGFELEI